MATLVRRQCAEPLGLSVDQRLQVGIAFGVGTCIRPGEEFADIGLDAHGDAAVLVADQGTGSEFFQSVATAQRCGVGCGREEEQFAVHGGTGLASNHQRLDASEVR